MATKEKVIDGIKFSVAPFRSTEGLRLKAFLAGKLGPSIGQFLGILKDGIQEEGINNIKLDGGVLSQAIEKLMGQLGEDEFETLIKRMFQNVTAYMKLDGETKVFHFTDLTFDNSMDIVFTGRLFSVYPVMLLVLEANYPDFFAKMATGIGERIRKMASSAKAGPTSAEGSETLEK
jgi:hypothetical protein